MHLIQLIHLVQQFLCIASIIKSEITDKTSSGYIIFCIFANKQDLKTEIKYFEIKTRLIKYLKKRLKVIDRQQF